MATRAELNTLARHIAAVRKAANVRYPSSIRLDWWHAPLCIRYNAPLSCEGCPVMAKTGKPRCEGTPREEIEPALVAWEDARAAGGGTAERKVYRAAVTAWGDWLEGVAS